MIFYVSPAEHSNPIRNLGRYSTIPEQHGADIISVGSNSRVGFQRKEVKDLFASLSDGRLSREILQLTNSDLISHAVLIIEGRLDWTTDGSSTIPYTKITQSQFSSLITGFQIQGIITHFTASPVDTATLIESTAKYLDKPRHSATIHRAANPRSPWGRTTNRGFGLYLLQSFPTIGPELAKAIYDHFNGVPLQWTVGAEDFAAVKGIGEQKAAALIASLAMDGTADHTNGRVGEG